jgi:hypothetical protein
MTTNWHVATAAEAIAAAQFARFGYDVSVQYGANQPEYDLTIRSPEGKLLAISVKGSADGGWGLTQGLIHASLCGHRVEVTGADNAVDYVGHWLVLRAKRKDVSRLKRLASRVVDDDGAHLETPSRRIHSTRESSVATRYPSASR